MMPAAQATTVARYRPGGSLLARIGSSSVFAWTLSLSLHAGLFLAFYSIVIREQTKPRVLIIPEARLGAAPGQGSASPAALNPGAPMPVPSAALGPSMDLPVLSVAAGDAGGPVLPGLQGLATGKTVPGSGSGGSIIGGAIAGTAGTGRGGAGGTSPVSSFFGQAGNAYKLVYVVDISGSVSYYLNDIRRELQLSIAGLLPIQQFEIVLAKSEVQSFKSRLVPANAVAKADARKFLDGVEVKVGQDPVEAMRRAFALSPELIYFLSDGDYRNVQENLEKTLRELNAKRQVKITVIAFDPAPGPARMLLERIARDHGGHFRVAQLK